MELLEQVKMELNPNIKLPDNVLQYYIDKAIDMAYDITGYNDLPSSILHYVVSVVVESINRRGNEGNSSKGALGVSTTFAYKDIEESLRKKLRGKKNPMLLVGKR